MVVSWTLLVTAFGALGWLLILREGLQRFNSFQTRKNISSQAFKFKEFSQPLGRVRFVTMEWNEHKYCLAIDMQGAYVQMIDKSPLTGKNA